MGIPVCYDTGFLGDIGVPSDRAPKGFSARFEVHDDGPGGPRRYMLDTRHNRPRIGRITTAYANATSF